MFRIVILVLLTCIGVSGSFNAVAFSESSKQEYLDWLKSLAGGAVGAMAVCPGKGWSSGAGFSADEAKRKALEVCKQRHCGGAPCEIKDVDGKSNFVRSNGGSSNEVLDDSSFALSNKDKEIVKNIGLPAEYITIALGGEWKYRTYNQWDKIIEKLIANNNNLNIVLIGSGNAKDISEKLLKKMPLKNLFNCVDQFTFNQTAQIIKKSQVLLCCDGGLMHAANSVNTPIVSLFARLTPKMQLTENIVSFTLFDSTDVNNVSVKSILEEYSKCINYVGSHLQVE